MTRNEWIARRSEKYYDAPSKDGSGYDWNPCINVAKADADALEAANVAPWQTPSPALTDTAAKVVEAAELWLRFYGDGDYDGNDGRKARLDLKFAVRAHLAAKQGGAK